MKPTQTKKPPEQPLSGLDACVCTHAALRKCCDSHITSCLYNVITLVDVKPEKFDPWRLYGILVAQRLQNPAPGKEPRSKLAEDALQTAAGRLEDEWFHQHKDDRQNAPDNALPALYSLVCLFRCLTPADWAGMAAFL